MPNWASNTVTIKGDKDILDVLMYAIWTRPSDEDLEKGEEERVFDFEKIVPMPKSLVISTAHRDEDLLLYCMKNDLKVPKEMEFMNPFANGYIPDLEVGKQVYENLVNYGHEDWYGWAIENWGTKWNSSGSENVSNEGDEDLKYCFETAWAPPTPIITQLSSMYPGLTIILQTQVEGWSDEPEEWIFKGGKIVDHNEPRVHYQLVDDERTFESREALDEALDEAGIDPCVADFNVIPEWEFA